MGMVSGGILEYILQGEVLNNYTTGSVSEVEPEIHKHGVTTKLSLDLEADIFNGLCNSSGYQSNPFRGEIIHI